jgi:hypothetical protein
MAKYSKTINRLFLLLEDDTWFTRKLIEETQKFLIEENVFSLKLFWLNNPNDSWNYNKKGSVTILIRCFLPKINLHRLILVRPIIIRKQWGLNYIRKRKHYITIQFMV